MITGEIKSAVGNIWNTIWAGGISNPLSVMEQLTYLLFLKRLDELHTLKELKASRTGKPIEDPIFNENQDGLRWSRFKELAPEEMFNRVKDEAFPFMKSLGGDLEDEAGSTYSHHMKDAIFMMPTPGVLSSVVDQLDSIDMTNRDTKGDLYEYMLGKIASAGQNGQFRTPRHIIQLMVDMIAPKPSDTICDPACGTAGFLIAASEYLVEHHSDDIYRDEASRQRFNEQTFHGYDFDTTMLRIGSMNMLLHGVENPDIRYKDSLAEGAEDDAERFSLILANPPFSGSLNYESTAKNLLKVVKTKKTELLFLALFARNLKQGGRAAVIVPAGVLESDSKAHESIRKMLVETLNLEAVIKLPHWVFKPYASVDTSILLFSKRGTTEQTWFFRVENDGFADDAAKSPIEGSELQHLLDFWRNGAFEDGTKSSRKHRIVSIEELRKNNYDLCPPFYLSGHSYPPNCKRMALNKLFIIEKGKAAASSAQESGSFPFYTTSPLPKWLDEAEFTGPAICIPTVSATGHGHAAINTIHLAEERFAAASITAVLIPRSSDVPVTTIYYYLLAHKDELLVPLMRGATNKSLNLNRLGELEVPLVEPSSKEGKMISELVEMKSVIADAKTKVKVLETDYAEKIRTLGNQSQANSLHLE